MILQFSLPDAIHASRVEGHRLHLEAHPENWSLGEWLSAGGILAAIATWCWKKPIKKFINMWSVPDRIELILKKLDFISSSVKLSTALSQLTWTAIPRPIWQSDANGMTVHVNEFMLKLLGRQDDEILGDGWMNIIHEDDRERVRREWDMAVRGKRNFHLHYKWVDRTGQSIPIVAQASRLLDTDGEVLGWVGFVSLIDS